MFRRLYEEMQVEVMNKDPLADVNFSLNEFRKKLESGEVVDWSFVRLHLGIATPVRRHVQSFFDVCFNIFLLLKHYQCRDISIIADALQIYCFEYEGTKKSINKAKLMREILINNQTCCERNGLNFVAKLMKIPYKTPSFISYEPMDDVIQKHILSREMHHLKFLLEFGVMYFQLSDHRSTWASCFQKLRPLLTDSEKKMMVNPRHFQLNIGKLSHVSRQRMLAVFRSVEMILKSRDTLLGLVNYAFCFRIAYETIPEPVITSHEVTSFLYYVFSGPSADEFIQEIRKEYESLFPESTGLLAPRSLKHLSRCQVRQNFRQAGDFPFGILDLNYPKDLKDYILAVDNKKIKQAYSSYLGPDYFLEPPS